MDEKEYLRAYSSLYNAVRKKYIASGRYDPNSRATFSCRVTERGEARIRFGTGIEKLLDGRDFKVEIIPFRPTGDRFNFSITNERKRTKNS